MLFGAKRLPEMGRSLGSGMREFRDGVMGREPSAPPNAALGASAESDTPAHHGAPAA